METEKAQEPKVPKFKNSLKGALYNLLNAGTYSDATISNFAVHKAILSARCKTLLETLSSNGKDERDDIFANVPPVVGKVLMTFIYIDEYLPLNLNLR